MLAYNYRKLLGRIKEKDFTLAEFAKEIGISEASLNARLKNRLPFKQDEIVDACAVLAIPLNELDIYFFAA